MMRALKANSIGIRTYNRLSEEEQAANQKVLRGVLHTNDRRVEYTRLYDEVIAQARGSA